MIEEVTLQDILDADAINHPVEKKYCEQIIPRVVRLLIYGNLEESIARQLRAVLNAFSNPVVKVVFGFSKLEYSVGKLERRVWMQGRTVNQKKR